MAEDGARIPSMGGDPRWTEAQWEQVNNAVTEQVAKAGVASSFLPCYGPLPPGQEAVTDQILKEGEEFGGSRLGIKEGVRVEEDKTLTLFELRVPVILSNQQVADPSMAGALLAIRRAANIVAQAEDFLVFSGKPPVDEEIEKVKKDNDEATEHNEKNPTDKRPLKSLPIGSHLSNYIKRGDSRLDGLIETSSRIEVDEPATPGERLVSAIAKAVSELENDNHPGPFTCILGTQLFIEAHTPNNSLVLPADRIAPIIGGQLLRSGQLQSRHPTKQDQSKKFGDSCGLVIAAGDNAIDLVIGTAPKAQFLQMTPDAKYLFRVYERFIMRWKDKTAVRRIEVVPKDVLTPDTLFAQTGAQFAQTANQFVQTGAQFAAAASQFAAATEMLVEPITRIGGRTPRRRGKAESGNETKVGGEAGGGKETKGTDEAGGGNETNGTDETGGGNK